MFKEPCFSRFPPPNSIPSYLPQASLLPFLYTYHVPPRPLPRASHTSLPRAPHTPLPPALQTHCHVHPTPYCHVYPHPIVSCNPHAPHVHLIHAQPQTFLTPPPHKHHMHPPYSYTCLTLSPHVSHPHPFMHLHRHTTYLSHICTSSAQPHLHLHTHTQMHLTCIPMCTSHMYLHVPHTETTSHTSNRSRQIFTLNKRQASICE